MQVRGVLLIWHIRNKKESKYIIGKLKANIETWFLLSSLDPTQHKE